MPLPPLHEKVLDASEVQHLTLVYNQLYQTKCLYHVSHYYMLCGRVTLGSDVIGSVLPGCNNVASSVIMACWAGSGSDLHAIDYSLMRVGGVQKFIKHKVMFMEEDIFEEAEHIFAYIKVAGAPIFTYTHEPDDNEIHNGCKTMLYYVRGALCKHTIMSFLYVSIQEK